VRSSTRSPRPPAAPRSWSTWWGRPASGLRPEARRAPGPRPDRRPATATPRSGEITGFSYTKINRCAAEGRAALRVAVNR
jgi:hypothetical protein